MLEKPNGQSRMDNPKKLSTLGTKDEDNQTKKTQHICVGDHYVKTNTNKVIEK